jgi:hypothetical protein
MIQELASGRKFSGFRRPRKATKDGCRYPGGQLVHRDRGERPENVIKTATRARQRVFGVSEDQARDPKMATVLGRFLIVGPKLGGISKRQYNAAVLYAKVRHWQNVLDAVPRGYGTPASASLATTSGRHPFDRIDPDLAWDDNDAKRRKAMIMDIRRKNADLTEALWRMEGSLETRGAATIMERVILWEDEFAARGDFNMGLLRCGLNVVAHTMGVEE